MFSMDIMKKLCESQVYYAGHRYYGHAISWCGVSVGGTGSSVNPPQGESVSH